MRARDIYRPRVKRQRVWLPGTPRAPKYWTATQIAYLQEHWSDVPVERIARKLGRSVCGVRVKAKRMGLTSEKCNWLCARQIDAILGVPDKKAQWLHEHGALHLTKSTVAAGSRAAWRCELEEFERFLRRETQWYRVERVREEPWRSIARAANKDPWLTLGQAARATGFKDGGSLWRYVRSGELPVVKVPSSGRFGYEYRVRKSASLALRPKWPELLGHTGGRGGAA